MHLTLLLFAKALSLPPHLEEELKAHIIAVDLLVHGGLLQVVSIQILGYLVIDRQSEFIVHCVHGLIQNEQNEVIMVSPEPSMTRIATLASNRFLE